MTNIHEITEDDRDFRRFALSWETIETAAKCFPELEDHTLWLIKYFIGYLPPSVIYSPHEAFIRALIANFRSGSIPQEQFFDEVEFHTKRIRNDDMKKGGWVKYATHQDADYVRYNTFLAIHKQGARERLSEFMGYEPSLDHSLEAELYLRELFQLDEFHSNMPYCGVDNKAVTIVRYREAFLLEGEASANDSDLIGLLYEAAQIKQVEKDYQNLDLN